LVGNPVGNPATALASRAALVLKLHALAHRALGEREITVEVVLVEDLLNRIQAVSGNSRDLAHGTPRNEHLRHRRPSQIVKCAIDNPGRIARTDEYRAEALRPGIGSAT